MAGGGLMVRMNDSQKRIGNFRVWGIQTRG
jgi:hypothetical protein